jgi:hypothetical protein
VPAAVAQKLRKREKEERKKKRKRCSVKCMKGHENADV